MPSTTPSRAQSTALIGGHPALDLVNTVSWRHDTGRRREDLAVPADLLTWTRRAGILDQHRLPAMRAAIAADPAAAAGVLRRVHGLREHLYDHLTGYLDDRGGDHQIANGSALQRAFAGAVPASLAGTPARWTLRARVPLDLPRVLALHALDLLQTMPLDRLRRCDDDVCGWLFLDTTRNHSCRWCSSGDCGNRDRARRHYARGRTTAHQDAPAPGGPGTSQDLTIRRSDRPAPGSPARTAPTSRPPAASAPGPGPDRRTRPQRRRTAPDHRPGPPAHHHPRAPSPGTPLDGSTQMAETRKWLRHAGKGQPLSLCAQLAFLILIGCFGTLVP
jgi:predicted RNA-binding Zn ribbon-like protein